MWNELEEKLNKESFESWGVLERPRYKRGGIASRSGFGISRGNYRDGTGGGRKTGSEELEGFWQEIDGQEVEVIDKEGASEVVTDSGNQTQPSQITLADTSPQNKLAQSLQEGWEASLEQKSAHEEEENPGTQVQPSPNWPRRFGERNPVTWLRTNRRNPCPCCGKFGWCEVSEHGNKAHCMHSQQEGRAVEYRGGGRIIQLKPESRVDTQYLYRPISVERLEPALIDVINQEFLKRCPLKPEHGAYLAREGVPTEGVGSLELHRATRIAGELVAKYGEEVARRHPLFKQFVTRDKQHRFWGIAGAENGILFPATNIAGRILGIQVRADQPTDKERRYRWLSSDGKGGTPLTVFPGQDRGERPTTIVITEGYKKAAVVNHAWGSLTISLAGVGVYNREELIETIRASEAREIAVAFDQDKNTKWQVQEAEGRVLKLLREQLPEVTLYRVEWEARQGKGIDEALKVGAKFRLEKVLEQVENPLMAGKKAAQPENEPSELTIAEAGQEAAREAQWAALRQLQADTNRLKRRGK